MSEVYVKIDVLLKLMGLPKDAVVSKVTLDLMTKVIILNIEEKP